jgi:phospholipid/cholesterol/gamma-HCH transport system permease protein
MLRIPLTGFYLATKHSLDYGDVRMGVIKSVAFGVIIAVCGCLRGLSSERDTAGVGRAATSAVVTSILWFVVADALFGRYFSGGA